MSDDALADKIDRRLKQSELLLLSRLNAVSAGRIAKDDLDRLQRNLPTHV